MVLPHGFSHMNSEWDHIHVREIHVNIITLQLSSKKLVWCIYVCLYIERGRCLFWYHDFGFWCVILQILFNLAYVSIGLKITDIYIVNQLFKKKLNTSHMSLHIYFVIYLLTCLSFWFMWYFTHQVFTWYGATIEMDGAAETDYTADEVHLSFLSKLY